MLENPGGITKANAHLLLLGLCFYHAWSWRSSQPAERHIKERGEESGESKVTRKIWGEEPHKKQMDLTVVRTAAQSRLWFACPSTAFSRWYTNCMVLSFKRLMLSKIALLFSLSLSLSIYPPPSTSLPSATLFQICPVLFFSQEDSCCYTKADQDGEGLHTCPSSLSWGLWIAEATYFA